MDEATQGDGGGVDVATPQRTSGQRRGRVRRTAGAVLARSGWLVGAALVLAGLRPTWTVPLQGDDIWMLFSIHAVEAGVWQNALDYTSAWIRFGTHFNPLGYLLDALLKGAMLASESTVLTPTALHHGTIALCSVLTLAAAASLGSSLIRLTTSTRVPAVALAVPLGVGFLASLQLTAAWANYDPLVTHPVYASLTTLVGFAYLAVGVRALAGTASTRTLAAGVALGVAGFLVYELFVVFVAAFTALLILYRRRLPVRRPWVMPLWLVGVPALTFVAARVFVASHDTVEYAGTELTLGPGAVAAWQVSSVTGMPGSLWGLAATRVDLTSVGPLALATGLVAGASFAVWAFARRRGAATVPGRTTLRAIALVSGLAALAPVPFAMSRYWSTVLVDPGQSYMHSLIQLWCWSLGVGLVLLEVARRRAAPVVVVALASVLTLWVCFQVNINRQLGVAVAESPRLGVDVTAVLEGDVPPTDDERCASLATIQGAGMYDQWDDILQREYDERFGREFCTTVG